MKRGERKVFFFENSNMLDELAKNVSNKSLSDELFLHCSFENSESSDRVFNHLHDSNSIFSGRGNSIRELFRLHVNTPGQICLPLEGEANESVAPQLLRESLMSLVTVVRERPCKNSLPCLLLCYASPSPTTWLCVSSPSLRSRPRRSQHRLNRNPLWSLFYAR